MNPKFEFTGSIKKALFYMMGIGVLGLVLVFFLYGENNHSRFWTNILANTYFFTGIGLFGLFLVAGAQIAYGHWHTLVKRILLSLSAFAAIGGFIMLLIIGLGFLNVHNLYAPITHILHTGQGDPVYTTKLVYFAPAFWMGRVLVYATLWMLFSWGMNKFFARTDQTNPAVYKRSKLISAAFIVVFALTESAISWDVIMSLDPHWYSTLFGWYNFASYGCAALGMTILLVLFLKAQGYLQVVNENHVHDLGKLLFGFSIFWTYLWFDQFMLQWYGNIPEETHFWVKRFDVGYFKFTIFLTLIVNFLFPLLFLITRSSKRNFKVIGFGAALLVLGHYVDFFNFTFVEPNWNKEAVEKEKEARTAAEQVVLYAQATDNSHSVSDATPAKENTATVSSEVTEKESGAGPHEAGEEATVNYGSIGIGELMIFVGFLGMFLYMFFNNLSKRPIIPEDDPYLKECERLEVIYA